MSKAKLAKLAGDSLSTSNSARALSVSLQQRDRLAIEILMITGFLYFRTNIFNPPAKTPVGMTRRSLTRHASRNQFAIGVLGIYQAGSSFVVFCLTVKGVGTLDKVFNRLLIIVSVGLRSTRNKRLHDGCLA
jgi:hypothetical protein